MIAAFLALLPVAAPAAPICERLGAETIFHCRIDGSTRELTVCEQRDGQFLYAFGQPGRPELEIARRPEQLSYRPWNGVGFSYWASLGFEEDGHHFVVSFDAVKDGSSPVTGGVDVYKPGNDPEGGRPDATRTCRPGTVESRLDEIEDRFR